MSWFLYGILLVMSSGIVLAEDSQALPSHRWRLEYHDGHPGTYNFPRLGDLVDVDLNRLPTNGTLRVASTNNFFGGIYLGTKDEFQIIHVNRDDQGVASCLLRATAPDKNSAVEVEFKRSQFTSKAGPRATLYVRRLRNGITDYLAVFRTESKINK